MAGSKEAQAMGKHAHVKAFPRKFREQSGELAQADGRTADVGQEPGFPANAGTIASWAEQ
ncbi:MAG: hypothetical protein OXB91_09655 [Bryobacterales bacterium]|nr:hypothetical protein [Bryobacterales bacterium]